MKVILSVPDEGYSRNSSVIPVSGCVSMGHSSLICPGAYHAVKTAIRSNC
jgi:hypothetical protein